MGFTGVIITSSFSKYLIFLVAKLVHESRKILPFEYTLEPIDLFSDFDMPSLGYVFAVLLQPVHAA